MIRETLTLSDYVLRVQEQSKIDPDATIAREVGMRCPRCKEVRPVIEHGETAQCWNCRLRMTVHGNALECVA